MPRQEGTVHGEDARRGREEKCQGKRAHPNGAERTEKALPSAGQGFFERLESEEGVRTLPPDLRLEMPSAFAQMPSATDLVSASR